MRCDHDPPSVAFHAHVGESQNDRLSGVPAAIAVVRPVTIADAFTARLFERHEDTLGRAKSVLLSCVRLSSEDPDVVGR